MIKIGSSGQIVFVAVVIGIFAALWFALVLYDRITLTKWRNKKYDPFLREVLSATRQGPNSAPLTLEEVGAFVRAASQPPRGTTGLTRTILALGLLTLVGVALVSLIVGDSSNASDTLKTTITALTASLTTVLGFYFGAKTASDGQAATSVAVPPLSPAKPTVPDAPTKVTAQAGSSPGTVSVSFTPPTAHGSLPITAYTVTSTEGDVTAAGVDSPILVTALTTDRSYAFTVHATSAAGDSRESQPSNQVTAP